MGKPAQQKDARSLPRYQWITLFKDKSGGFRYAVVEAGIDAEGELDQSEITLVSARYPNRWECEERFRIWVADNLMREGTDE